MRHLIGSFREPQPNRPAPTGSRSGHGRGFASRNNAPATATPPTHKYTAHPEPKIDGIEPRTEAAGWMDGWMDADLVVAGESAPPPPGNGRACPNRGRDRVG